MFVRSPEPGAVKTRLIPTLGAAGAARLQAAFVADLCARFAPRFSLTLACTPDVGDPRLVRLARCHHVALTAQEGADLGARMRRVAARLLERARRVVIVGSDAPTLPSALVADAFRALRRVPVVLGPSLDGGYYLVGVSRDVPAIFTRMRWGTSGVLASTVRRLVAGGIGHELLPWWYDVDVPADLDVLARELALHRARGENPCPATRRALAALRRRRGAVRAAPRR